MSGDRLRALLERCKCSVSSVYRIQEQKSKGHRSCDTYFILTPCPQYVTQQTYQKIAVNERHLLLTKDTYIEI